MIIPKDPPSKVSAADANVTFRFRDAYILFTFARTLLDRGTLVGDKG